MKYLRMRVIILLQFLRWVFGDNNCELPNDYAATCSSQMTKMATACFRKGDDNNLQDAFHSCINPEDKGSHLLAVEEIKHFLAGNDLSCKKLGDGQYYVDAVRNKAGVWVRYSDREMPVDFKSFNGNISKDCNMGEGLVWFLHQSESTKISGMGELHCSNTRQRHRTLCLSAFVIPPFDLETDNALFWANQVIAKAKGPFSISLYARHRAFMSVAAFDALTPYYENAHPVLMGQHHASEKDKNRRNKNIAILYAYFTVTKSMAPFLTQGQGDLRVALMKLGLDPDATVNNPGTDAALYGILAGKAVINAYMNDGLNQWGDIEGQKRNLVNYSDYTKFESVNTAFRLVDPTKWQPQIEPVADTIGQFSIQTFATPQLKLVKPITMPNSSACNNDLSVYGRINASSPDYKYYVDYMINISYNLNDNQKMLAELYKSKPAVIPSTIERALLSFGIIEIAAIEMGVNLAVYDAMISVWGPKIKNNGVRPQVAIRYYYGHTNSTICAWGGPGQGGVCELNANEFVSYLPTAAEPEYPSASTAFCSTLATTMKALTKSDKIGFDINLLKGSSKVEPGTTPKTDILYQIKTWSQFEKDCGLSRQYAGDHFPDSVNSSIAISHCVSNYAVAFVNKYFKLDN